MSWLVIDGVMTDGPPSSQPLARSLLLTAVSAALIAALGCGGRVHQPPYSMAFDVDGGTPRVLHAWNETVVPIRITNTGTRAWDPALVHVSYHWLWLIPRELPKRSRWSLPYHDGIRSELSGTVKPGGAMPLDSRLLAPRWPGLYWLQWDMVEEGVTWFAQVSPRQPRQLVIVLPTLAGLATPLPFLIALIGLWAARSNRGPARSTSFAAAGDVAWCATALAAKPLILARDVVLEPSAVAYWLVVVTAVAPPLLCLAVFSPRVRAWLLLLCGLIGSLVIVGDELYYRFFGNVLSVAALFSAGQTGHVWSSVRSLVAPEMLWLVLDLPLAFWLVITIARQQPAEAARRSRQPFAVVAALAVGMAGAVLAFPLLRSSELEKTFSARSVMEQLGPLGYHAFNVWTYTRYTVFRPAITADRLSEVQVWFAERRPLRAGRGPWFGAATGKNLIVIQVESLQDFAVDYRVNGESVMPHLAQWTGSGLRFTNVTDQTSEGRTSDAEFATLVSLPPLDRGAVAFRFAANHYVGLPGVLSEHGYATLSAVPFEPGFWNRRVMHPSYGFQESLFQSDFTLTDQIGWGLNDHEFLQQMVPRLAKLRQPFAAWLITLSLHHPFDDFPDRHKVLKLGSLEHTSFGNYLHTMRFFDQALAAFETSLARAGLLDDAVLVVFGDHDAGFQRNVASAMGVRSDDAGWELNDRVPLFVRLPRAAAKLTGAVSIAAGQTDFAPTLLALMGVDPAPLPYTGRNLLGEPGDGVLLRPYGNWLDRTRLFIDRGASERDRACFALDTASFVDVGVCQAADDDAQESRNIASLVVTGDLQQRLRALLAATAD